jgi:hypothetical protein
MTTPVKASRIRLLVDQDELRRGTIGVVLNPTPKMYAKFGNVAYTLEEGDYEVVD